MTSTNRHLHRHRALRELGLAVGLIAIATGSSSEAGEAGELANYQVVGPRHPVRAGERVRFTLVPSPPAGTRVSWYFSAAPAIPSGPAAEATSASPGASGTAGGYGITYLAPFVIRSEVTQVRVSAGLTGGGLRASASTVVRLEPGSVSGAEECLGPGQSFAEEQGGLVPDYTFADELPMAIRRVEPEYPRSSLVRGVKQTIVVRALVCRSGRVLGAAEVPHFSSPGVGYPIEDDPKLVEAAIAAVMQWEFRPARAGGEAIAVRVDVPIAFPR